MKYLDLLSICITLSAIIGYLNNRYFKLPTTIAILSGALLISLSIILVGKQGFQSAEYSLYQAVIRLDFHHILMQGMLSYLLFAGALTININHLRQCRYEIATLATISTLSSTLLVGLLCYYLIPIFGHHLSFKYCLLFGALISPTDPIAVLAIFKKIGAPQKLNITVSGESLFNDGVGIVLFITIYQVAFNQSQPTFLSVTSLFLQEAIGGIVFGIILGLIGHWMIRGLNDSKVILLITLSITTTGYSMANSMQISGPLAMVAAGIFIGNKGKTFNETKRTRQDLYLFWELIDELLNVVLFFLIGIELLQISHTSFSFILALFSIIIVLLSRFITVAIPMAFFKIKNKYPPFFTTVLIWGGLRGGLAVALALSLPVSKERAMVLTMTYAVVLFSILIQGLTVKPIVKASSSKPNYKT
jgi:Na+:H+ antiporter